MLHRHDSAIVRQNPFVYTPEPSFPTKFSVENPWVMMASSSHVNRRDLVLPIRLGRAPLDGWGLMWYQSDRGMYRLKG